MASGAMPSTRGEALAFLDLNRDQAEGLETVQIDIAGEFYSGKVIRKAAFDPSGQRMKV